jgi:predicted dehydrogenase
MRRIWLLLLLTLTLRAQDYKIAVVGLVHAHAWGHLRDMVAGKAGKLVGVAEPNPELVAEAKKAGVPAGLIFSDYEEMLEKTRPDIVWAFVENNRHLEIAKACLPRMINLIFEKPLASTYKDAKEIQTLAAKYNVRVMTNYQMAWWPANYVAKASADRGDVGKVWRLHGIVGHGGPGSDGPRNKYFFDWLTDPEKNGAGALMDFGCYNALWSLWYLGKPDTVFATVNHLRPDRFPRVEDNANLELHYANAVGIFEGSWDLPRSYQDLEVFGYAENDQGGLLTMNQREVTLQKGREKRVLELAPLSQEASDPVAYMISRIKANLPIEGLTAIDINVDVIKIIELAKESVKSGKAVKFQ